MTGTDDGQFLFDRVTIMFKDRVPLAMAGTVCVHFTNRERRRGPGVAGFIVTQINDL